MMDTSERGFESAQFQGLKARADAAHDRADFRALKQCADEIVALGERTTDEGITAWGAFFRGLAAIHHHDGNAATSSFESALAHFREVHDDLNAAKALMNLASVAIDIDVAAARGRRLYEEAAELISAMGDSRRMGTLHGNLGEVCRLEGDYLSAIRYGLESLRLFIDAGDCSRAAWQLVNLAHYHLMRRDRRMVVEYMKQAQTLLLKDPNPLTVAWYFDLWIIVAAKRGRWEHAATLVGFAERFRSENDLRRMEGILPWISEPLERLNLHLPNRRSQALVDEGARYSLAQAQAIADELAADLLS